MKDAKNVTGMRDVKVTLKEIAKVYYLQGNNIVPINSKKEPLVKWAKWETQRQTIEEFEALPWSETHGFCVVCGLKLKNGMYIGAIDVDVKHTTQEVIDRGLALEKQLRTTHIEETVSGGKHFIYYSRTPIVKAKDARKIFDYCGCELLGEKKLCIMSPSFAGSYKRWNDNPPTGIESLNVLFETALKKIGYRYKTKRVKNRLHTNTNLSVRPCISKLMENKHLTHLEKVAVVTEHNFSGMEPEDIEKLFREYRAWEEGDYDLEKTQYQINHIIENKYKRFGKATLEDMGLCFDNCPIKDSCMRSRADFEDEEEKFNPILFAKHLLETAYFKTPRETETLYIYDQTKGIYNKQGEIFVKEQMVKDLDEDTRHRHLADILFFIKGKTYFNMIDNPVSKIAVENGVLDVLTRELTPHGPETFITTQIPIIYDKTKECPKIKQFLKEVVTEEQLPIMQEIIGYCLYKDMPIHKALMLIGDGANGKSTLLELIKLFLGIENISSVSLQSLCYNRFAIVRLHGKLANICADLPDAALKQTGMFKMLTGADTVEAEEKFKQSFSFKNYTKLLFSTNKVPETKDDTTAFFRRWILLICNNIFIGKKCNTNILKEITDPDELSGLLNYALDGMDRILKNSKFSTSENIEDLRKQYIRKSNSAKAFIEEKLFYENDPAATIPTTTLYRQYVMFCRQNGLPTMGKRSLTINMQEHLPQARQTMIRISGKGTRVWQFIKTVTTVTPSLFNGNKSYFKGVTEKEE